MSCADSTTGPGPGTSSSRLLPLLETLEDATASPGSLTDALLTLTNRLTGEEGKEFAVEVGKYFPQLYKIFKTYIPMENSDLSSAALQALGFCVFNAKIASQLCDSEVEELLSIVSSVAVKASDKNIRTRALWVISKQSFSPVVVGKMVPSIVTMLETILNKGDLHSMVVEYEALNVIIRLIEQVPSCMEEQAVRWAKLIIPLVVHSAHKVQLRGATALEMGIPLLLQKQQEVAAVTEELMTTKVIPELQKLFSSKNDTYVLKLWPLFVKLLGKTLHRSGSFINSLLQLEELGFRSGSPVVKKIAFIAWKSLIDNFALNPEILCSAKRLKLLMQPLSSIHVRTEALALTKLEVWWYLLMRLGPQLPAHFEQVCVPLIQSTLGLDASLLQGNSSRLAANQSLATPGSAQKSGAFPYGTSVTPRMSLNSSTGGSGIIPAIQLLGIEMLLHFFLGPEVLNFAKENTVVLSLEPLQYSVITSPSFFCKHANTFINAIQDGFIAVGKDVSDIVLNAIWKGMIGFVRAAVESGSKKERQNSEVLTMLLQALKNIVMSNELPVLKSLSLLEITIKELPPKVLGSPAYQVANMDLLNGTPALFLIQLSFRKDLMECCVQDERFFLNYESLVSSVLSGPTSPLAFSESVFIVVNQSAIYLENKEHLWRIWSIVVNPLTEWINQTNEVNQGDALEHNFNAIYSVLLLPVTHIFPACEFPQPTMKSLLRSWSELYKAFARCSSLVATAEDNLCCEELCAKIISELDKTQINCSMLDGLSHIVSIMVDCINFAPYGTKSQPLNKSPHTPTDWSKKKKDPLGKLSSLIRLVAILINSAHVLWSKESSPEKLIPVAASIVSILQNIISHISLPSVIRSVCGSITKPVAVFFEKARFADGAKANNTLSNKFEKLWLEIISCLQSHYTGSFDSQLLQELSPLLCVMFTDKNKQIRNQAAQFWNATFGKATTMTYPEELKSVLCQAKQKVLLLLPGFESTEIMGESNGTYSDSQTENSQWDTKISGIEVKSSGKRDSLLAQSGERKEKNINCHVPPAKTKLEFSLPKTNRKDVILEEENTVDFVFIPPETKERVLTEHQKEVLQTKRVDIPAMYNNLDASQDTALFSQYTQDQEASLVKPTLVDMKEEDGNEEGKEISQVEKVASNLLGSENCKPNVLLEKTGSTAIAQLQVSAKHSPDQNDEDSELCNSKTVPQEPSVLDQSVNESASSVSSSSSSSDIISGTPQPVSRRQSFITLEKFNNSGNRPFSPSEFNNVSRPSGSTPSLDGQESMIGMDPLSSKEKSSKSASRPQVEETVSRSKRSCPESIDTLDTFPKAKKAKEESKAVSKLQSESTLGIKKSSLRQNKIELSEDKKVKPMGLEQEKNMQVSTSKDEVEECDLLGETQEPQCTLNIQSQASDFKIIGNTTVENKHVLNSVAEMRAGLNLDSKENTPPEVTVLGDAISVGQTPQIPPNQKILRRSLRRKPETSEGSADSQDKENSQQKKDRHKDDEKLLPKKSSQSKEDSTHKQKSLPEKNLDLQGIVNKKESHAHESSTTDVIATKESNASKNLLEETNVNIRKSEGSSAPETHGLQDPCADSTHEKRKGLPRYQTRRASQGLLSSIENAESDSNSETREEGAKKKRSGRWKVTTNSLEIPVKENSESQSQELHSQETANEIQTSLVGSEDVINHEECMEIALPSGNNEEREQNVPTPNNCLGVKETVDASVCGDHSGAEQTVAKVLAKPISGPAPKTKQITRVLDQEDSVPHSSTSGLTELSGDPCTAVPNDSSASRKPLETPECSHKRSKRMRRSKGCDCCDEKPAAQLEKSTPEVKKASSPEPKSKEPKKTSSKAAVVASSLSAAEESPPAEKLFVEPCATSTPQSFTGEPADLENSSRSIESTGELLGSYTPTDDSKESAGNKNESFKSAVDCIDGSGETSEPSSVECSSKEYKTPCQGSESKPEPVVTIEGAVHHIDDLEDRSHAEVVMNQVEETKSSEPMADDVQNGVEKNPECSVGSPVEAQDTDMAEEESIETDVPVALIGPETSALVQNEVKESNNIDSPSKLKEFDALTLAKMSESPNGVQARCMWSPSASPSTSILKRGVKRQEEEEDSPSPANKSRRVSFANPIYQEELADDIDRRSPAVRTHSSNGSLSSRSIKPSSNHQAKPITTPTKGSLSPGFRSLKYKSSKKCLISEMVKETLPLSTESIYPALKDCKAPVDTILPQITSNIWARGLGQLIRAKNIRTVGDLSSLTAAEIKTLPIRSPKVSNVRRALKGYHEQQQLKYRGSEEIAAVEDTDKTVSGTHEKPFSSDEEKVAAGLLHALPTASFSATAPSTSSSHVVKANDSYPLGTDMMGAVVQASSFSSSLSSLADLNESMTAGEDAQSPVDLVSQISVLAAQMSSENLHSYSGSELFEMQEKLHNMTNCIMKNLQSRWKSSLQESTV